MAFLRARSLKLLPNYGAALRQPKVTSKMLEKMTHMTVSGPGKQRLVVGDGGEV